MRTVDRQHVLPPARTWVTLPRVGPPTGWRSPTRTTPGPGSLARRWTADRDRRRPPRRSRARPRTTRRTGLRPAPGARSPRGDTPVAPGTDRSSGPGTAPVSYTHLTLPTQRIV